MNRKTKSLLIGLLLVLMLSISACGAPATLTVVPSPTPEFEEDLVEDDISGAAAKAVDLIGAWVDSGASEMEEFSYTGVDGNKFQASFQSDILPLFTENGLWFEGSQACASCHFANTENSYHEMDLTSYQGIMIGGDALSKPPGVPLFGQSEVGATDFDWDHAKLRGRLRNNRMPPGWDFDITEENRDGACIEVSGLGVNVLLGEYGCDLNAVGLIAAWVQSDAPNGKFSYDDTSVDFERDVLPFFTEDNMWFEGSQACTGCHFANSENSYHEMNLSSYEGILTGADSLSSPPGVSILGESAIGAGDFDWDHSKLKERLRNNRMAPGWDFDITEENRDGPLVLHGMAIKEKSEITSLDNGECEVKAVNLIGAWTTAGASEDNSFDFTAEDGKACEGTFQSDILPLFTENGLWFEGSQACASCHFANTENSYHEMDLTSYQGIMIGGDALSKPPGVPLFGQSEVGATDFDWDHAKLRGRLRNNRMPPGWDFDITEENRDGACIEVSGLGVNVLLGEYGCDLNAVGLIAAWVQSDAPNGKFSYDDTSVDFERDVLPFFTEDNMWFEGSQACTGCHFANSENSYHEMNLSSYEGILTGADSLSSPPGVSILGESAIGAGDFDWDHSKLKERLRNNRMAPGWDFDITEENRDGPLLLAGTIK